LILAGSLVISFGLKREKPCEFIYFLGGDASYNQSFFYRPVPFTVPDFICQIFLNVQALKTSVEDPDLFVGSANFDRIPDLDPGSGSDPMKVRITNQKR
jgi:hypothetical protein